MHPSYFLKIHFNIILQSTPSSSKWPLSLRFPTKTLYAPLSPHTCYMPRPSYSSRIIIIITIIIIIIFNHEPRVNYTVTSCSQNLSGMKVLPFIFYFILVNMLHCTVSYCTCVHMFQSVTSDINGWKTYMKNTISYLPHTQPQNHMPRFFSKI